MTAADIIAREFQDAHRRLCYPDALDFERELFDTSVLSALAASGYRILAPDELDAKTIEACAKVVQETLDPSTFVLTGPVGVIAQAVTAIRALAKQEAKE